MKRKIIVIKYDSIREVEVYWGVPRIQEGVDFIETFNLIASTTPNGLNIENSKFIRRPGMEVCWNEQYAIKYFFEEFEFEEVN